MTTRKLVLSYAVTGLVIGVPFSVAHLMANPNDAAITLVQRLTASVANYFGPWGVVIVRVVDFPNAGLRSFSWTLAVCLTLVGGLLLVLAPWTTKRVKQVFLIVVWALFSISWFGVGMRQIADGLL